MKILLFLLLPFLAHAQGGITWGNDWFGTLDCRPYERFTEWVTTNDKGPGDVLHTHTWVYAEREDVNLPYFLSTGEYCVCGCPKKENEARICSECLQHQERTREYGEEPVKTESDYVKLKKKAGL